MVEALWRMPSRGSSIGRWTRCRIAVDPRDGDETMKEPSDECAHARRRRRDSAVTLFRLGRSRRRMGMEDASNGLLVKR